MRRQNILAACWLSVTMLGFSVDNLPAVELQDGLISYWSLDEGEGTVVADPFGSVADNGELRLEPSWLTGDNAKFGNALGFNGIDQDVLVPNSTDMDIVNNAVSLSAWVNLDILPSNMEDSFAGIFDSFDDNYVMYLDRSAQELRFKVTDAEGVAERPGVPELLLSQNTWHHVLGVYDGEAGEAKIYLDGEFIDSHQNLNLTGPVRTGQISSIGANATLDDGNPATRFFAGGIDDVAVWNRPLGRAEASYLFNAGTGNAVGAANPDITFVPDMVDVIVPVQPRVDPLVHFEFEGNLDNSGTAEADLRAFHLDMPDLNEPLYGPASNGLGLDVSDNPPSDPLNGDAVEFEFTMPDNGTVVFDYGVDEYYNFQSLWTNSVDANDWEMWIYNDGRVRGRVDGNSFAEFDLDNLGGVDETYQIAFSWEREEENVTVTLFVDGEQRDQDIQGSWVDPGELVYIGGGDGTNHLASGIFDDFQIYDYALTPGEVLYLFSGVCDPETSGDLDGNGMVEFADFLVLSANFGTSVSSHELGDIDCDGEVGFADFLVLSANFGTSPGEAESVPEPSGLCLALIAMAATLGRRSRRQ